MSIVSSLRLQHSEIGQIVQQMNAGLDAVALRDPAKAERMRSLLAQLAGKVKVHLAMENKSLYPTLSASKNAATAQVGSRFVSEMTKITEAFEGYMKHWPSPSSLTKDPAGFVRETQAIFGALADRIKREEAELYPLADAA